MKRHAAGTGFAKETENKMFSETNPVFDPLVCLEDGREEEAGQGKVPQVVYP